MVKEHLAGSGNRHQRGPGTQRQTGDGIGARGFDDGVQQQLLRHGRRAFGLAQGIARNHHFKILLFLNLRAAGAGFEQSAFDPLGDEINFRRGNFVALGRHEWLLLKFHALEQRRVGIARINANATASTGQSGGVGTEIEATLFLVGVVAVETAILKHRTNVILIGNFVLSHGGQGSGEKESENDGSHVCLGEITVGGPIRPDGTMCLRCP